MTSRNFTAIVNPIAGGGAAASRWHDVAERLRQRGHTAESVESSGSSHATQAAAEAAAAGRIVVAVGGDGTVRDVVSGIATTGATMAIVPSGRGNDLVKALDIPSDPTALADLLDRGPIRSIDLIQVGDLFIPGNIYLGLDGRSTEMINRFRNVPAALLYRLAPFLATVGWRRFEATITSSTQASPEPATKTLRAHMVLVANSGRYGHGLNMVPTASLDDGELDVFVVHGVNVLRLTSLMPQAAKGTHMSRPDISTWKTTTTTISADRPLAFYADGEKIGDLPVTVSVRPGLLKVIAPAAR